MDHLPVFFDVRNKKILVTGGGAAAARRAELALGAGARVVVFAGALSDEFRDARGHERFTHTQGFPSPADIEGAALCFGADEDRERNAALTRLAREARVPVNVADTPELCDFIMPAILDRSPLVAAISSSGASPILARNLKAQLETLITPGHGELAAFAQQRRDRVSARLGDVTARRRFWESVMDGAVADLVLKGDMAGAEREFSAALDAAAEGSERAAQGEVYLVGAGPGDPDLLTFRALRLMQKAEVVLYDRLVGPDILALVRREAERIYVGKEGSDHSLPQAEISRKLAELAKAGKRVLRLKGGDPFIFGRGGEEIEELAREGVPFQVVPGITAAAGCAAYAGIPLTHRDHAQTCIFVTGHMKDGRLDLDWPALVRPGQTLAVYMGLAALDALAEGLKAHGAPADLPAAVVDNGTRPNQRVVTGTLDTIGAAVAAAGLEGPAMTIVGSVVSLHGKLAWFGGAGRGAE
jgi:uroporphyrin-III C-methyltransferase / precorrin-2 dehydrogenase / sirohydrochlorin ferrochelatase